MNRQRGYSDGGTVLISIVLVVLLAVMAVAMIADNKEWAKFSAAHKCKKVAEVRGEAFNTINSSGSIGIGFTSDKTGYLCDDGITYFR
jgi:hypothetical protein